MSTINPAAQVHAITSPLLEKALRLGLLLPIDLERLAIARGCSYYQRDLPPRVPSLGEIALSNSEIVVALVVPCLRPSAREIRLAAALLAAPDVRVEELVKLANQE